MGKTIKDNKFKKNKIKKNEFDKYDDEVFSRKKLNSIKKRMKNFDEEYFLDDDLYYTVYRLQ